MKRSRWKNLLIYKLVTPLRATQNDLQMNGGDFFTIVLIIQRLFFTVKTSKHSPFLQTFTDWVVSAGAAKQSFSHRTGLLRRALHALLTMTVIHQLLLVSIEVSNEVIR